MRKVGDEGFSYSQYRQAFNRYQDQFGYYIFNEDDYFPMANHFDAKLKNLFSEFPRCGLLCGLVERIEHQRQSIKHAAVSYGITSFKVLDEVWNKRKLPHKETAPRVTRRKRHLIEEQRRKNPYLIGGKSQIIYSKSYQDAGFRLFDITDDFQTVYHCGATGKFKRWGKGEALFLPAQLEQRQRKIKCPCRKDKSTFGEGRQRVRLKKQY